MSEDSQIVVPDSFIALYRLPGRSRLSAPGAEITQRYGFCEDLAQMLTEHARGLLHDQGMDEREVLARCRSGLQSTESGVAAAESVWVVRRLAELLDWPDPGPADAA